MFLRARAVDIFREYGMIEFSTPVITLSVQGIYTCLMKDSQPLVRIKAASAFNCILKHKPVRRSARQYPARPSRGSPPARCHPRAGPPRPIALLVWRHIPRRKARQLARRSAKRWQPVRRRPTAEQWRAVKTCSRVDVHHSVPAPTPSLFSGASELRASPSSALPRCSTPAALSAIARWFWSWICAAFAMSC